LTNNVGSQPFIGDGTRVQQILVNLVSNSIKFTDKGGISVTSDYELQENDKYNINITVADSGVGISPDKLPTIFDKFVQADQTISRRFGGSGLGLSICLSLAHLMGGDIKVISTPGKGSIFTFSVPLAIDRQKKTKSLAEATDAPMPQLGFQGTVLVVEDYSANVMVASMMLENLGYAVDVANSGTEAIEKVRARKTPYAAILMDVQMQDMNGFETTRHIRTLEAEKGFRHMIIGATAHALAGDRDQCIDAGMDDYMSKPLHPDLLAEKLRTLPEAA
jgi:CheY-like chemotaxis protein